MGDLIIRGTTAHLGKNNYRVAIGKRGFSSHKTEGDGATPVGQFPIRMVYYRADRIQLPPALPFITTPLTPEDGWCDDPADAAYNRHVKRPFAPSHEKLWREEAIYDVIMVMGHNDDPVVPDKGSAIFTHIARKNYTPTEGCLAFSQADLLDILSQLTPDSKILIQG